MMTAESVRCYALKIDDNGRVVGDYSQDDDRPDLQMDKLVRAYMARNGCDYPTAFDAVMASPEHAALVRAYAIS